MGTPRIPRRVLEARKHVGKSPIALSKLPRPVRRVAEALERRKMGSLFRNPNQKLPGWFVEKLSVKGRRIAYCEGAKPMVVWVQTLKGFKATTLGEKAQSVQLVQLYDEKGVPVRVK